MKKNIVTSEVGPGCLLFFAKVMFIVFVAILLFSCKSKQSTLNDTSAYSSRDSVRTVIISRVDSFIKRDTLIVRDTLYLESEKNTNMKFGLGGGTYNVFTGAATNLSEVNMNEFVKQLQITNTTLLQSVEKLSVENTQLKDSLSNVNQKNNIQTSYKETTKTNWYWWFISGAVSMFIAIFVLKKLPQTRWLVRWI